MLCGISVLVMIMFCSSVDRCDFFWFSIGNNYVLFCSSVDGSHLFCLFRSSVDSVICLQAGVPRGGDGGRELCGR